MDWRTAEAKVAIKTGGKITPGSGCGSKKGDVWINKGSYVIEVKYTEKDFINIERNWIDKMMKEHPEKDLCLVVFIGSSPFPFFYRRGAFLQSKHWKTMKVTPETMPDALYCNHGVWELGSWEELGDL